MARGNSASAKPRNEGRQQAEAAAKREQEAKAAQAIPTATPANAAARIRLGEINALISPLSILQRAWRQVPVHRHRQGGKAVRRVGFPRMVDALVHVLRSATAQAVANG